jgi:hypothetical protein
MEDKGEPPSTARAKSLFRVGRNSRGNWVVQDPAGLCGGLFVDRVHALKYAMSENGNGNRPRAVVMVPDVLELELSGSINDPCVNALQSENHMVLRKRVA